jgi:ribose transport system permease protein
MNSANPRWIGRLAHLLGQYAVQWLLLLAVIVLALLNEHFRQLANLQSVLLQASFAGMGAAGMTLLIVSGAFDLSVAGLIGLCGVALAELFPLIGMVPAILVAVVLGVILGIVNGLVVTKVRIPAFIATLGMMYVYMALAFIWTNAQVIPVAAKSFRFLGTGTLFGLPLPVPFATMIVIYLLGYGILRFTTYGRYIRAVGSNETAARAAGLPVDRIRIVAFALGGFFTAVAGVFLTAYLSSANAIMATGYELRVIAVAVVGGTSLRGGQGTLFGSFTGALFFTVISNALNMFRVDPYWQYVATGLVLITALSIEAVRRNFMGVARA